MQSIIEARKALGLTQEQLAKMVGVTQGTIAQWENGMTHPAFDKLHRLSRVLGITVDDLIGKEEEHAS